MDEKHTNSVHMEEERPHEHAMAVSKAVANYEEAQHAQTKVAAVKENWKGMLWCAYMFFICVMFGYDSLAGNIVISITQFREDFGYPYDGGYVVSADWQLAFQAATLGGLVIGGWVTGLVVNRWGRQVCVLGGYMLTIGGVFLQYFSRNTADYFGAKLLTGIPLGEISPLVIRGSITAGTNFAIVLGQLLGYGVTRQASFLEGAMQYKVIFAVQWGFAGVGLAILPFFPESPYWLVAHGRIEKARHNIVRLHNADYDVDGHLAEISEALAKDRSENEEQASFADCFKRDHWQRTLACVSIIFIQNACGNSTAKAFDASVGMSGVMVVGNLCGTWLVEQFGRRGTALYGTATLCVTLFLIGILACINSSGAIWGQVAFMGVWSFVYQASIGSVAWPIISENPSSRLRVQCQALATIMNGLSACIWGFALPYAINPDQGNLGGKIAFVFGAVLVFAVVPETKGRTYVEIDELYNNGVSPRKFKETNLVSIVQ
ncbi:putative General alpha-glucoside permease [Glarea lozoyensis 74030]|uniref:Putative General alpha-glucoside permease n=1 Tax=Glarea lozoyensis (strain ATCC 74030 / MF5533) TaxID=1104152 RepID=H0ER02_GLAL7|nr:putative General alpha-glucoside permease [Glarea lozoyensis 74030]